MRAMRVWRLHEEDAEITCGVSHVEYEDVQIIFGGPAA